MSTESSKTLLRQWHIVRYLLNGPYVSTADVCEHLASVGIEAEKRTVQRDLRTLEKIFPLECREDSVPHGWRWKRPPETPSVGLKMDQALTLRLVEEQLQDVLPAKVREELQPLFLRARLVTGGGASLLPSLIAGAAIRPAGVMATGGLVPSFWTLLTHQVNPLRGMKERKELEDAREVVKVILSEQELFELSALFI